MISRRGFLQTMAAAAVGAAVYDVDTKLWRPAQGGLILPADAGEIVLAQQHELNLAAAWVAHELGGRLERHNAFGLRDIIYRHTGNVDLPAGVLDLLEVGPGRFQGLAARKLIVIDNIGQARMHAAAGAMSMHIIDRKLDAFAPLTTELRPGESFDKDMLFGIATDPETGMSVRAMRWTQVAGGQAPHTLYGFEIAAGRWEPYQVPCKKLATAAALCALSTFGEED